MNAPITKLEVGVLAIHMNIMRQSVKKLLKKQYNKEERKAHLTIYDSIKTKAGQAFEEEVEDINLDEEQTNLVGDFLDSYLNKVANEFDMNQLSQQDQEQFNVLENLKEKIAYAKKIEAIN